jgi:hypothetical protein
VSNPRCRIDQTDSDSLPLAGLTPTLALASPPMRFEGLEAAEYQPTLKTNPDSSLSHGGAVDKRHEPPNKHISPSELSGGGQGHVRNGQIQDSNRDVSRL